MGFTLIESVLSILIVGLMLVAALNTVGASKLGQARNAEQAVGPILAQQLLDEIVDQPYAEASSNFGREAGESATVRTDWDDVDDYHGWSGKPQLKNGTLIDGMDDWNREVSVTWASMLVPNNPSGTPTGLKRIDVTVRYQGRVVTQLSSLRTEAWDAQADTVNNPVGGAAPGP